MQNHICLREFKCRDEDARICARQRYLENVDCDCACHDYVRPSLEGAAKYRAGAVTASDLNGEPFAEVAFNLTERQPFTSAPFPSVITIGMKNIELATELSFRNEEIYFYF